METNQFFISSPDHFYFSHIDFCVFQFAGFNTFKTCYRLDVLCVVGAVS